MLRPCLLAFLWALPALPLSINKTEHVVKWTGYTNQAALERHLKELAKEAPDIASTFSLGQSEQVSIGRTLVNIGEHWVKQKQNIDGMHLKGRELFGLKLAVGAGERPLLRLISIR